MHTVYGSNHTAVIRLLDCTVCVSVLLGSIDPFSCEFYYAQRRICPAIELPYFLNSLLINGLAWNRSSNAWNRSSNGDGLGAKHTLLNHND